MDRNHLSESDAKKRIKTQMPLEKKAEQSHFVIENSGKVIWIFYSKEELYFIAKTVL